jgi:polysaccharide deacetylase 2 family uncharacterized protein YibQ
MASLTPHRVEASMKAREGVSLRDLAPVFPRNLAPGAGKISEITVLSPMPMIALVIDDIGPARQWSQQALDLPAPVTLSILPYVADAADWAAQARAAGHDVLLHMPMEPVGMENPGPGALLRRLSVSQNRQRLEGALLRVPGVMGVNNHMGSRFTACASCVGVVGETLQEQGLMFLDSVTSQQSAAARIIGKSGVPVLRRDVFLDDIDTSAAIAVQMRRAEALALTQGAVVVIAHPRPATMRALSNWQNTLKKQGIEMVSLREIMSEKQARDRGLSTRTAGL